MLTGFAAGRYVRFSSATPDLIIIGFAFVVLYTTYLLVFLLPWKGVFFIV